MPSKNDGKKKLFFTLAPHCALKKLEQPYLYNLSADQLYELDNEALAFLSSSPPSRAARKNAARSELLSFCIREGLVTESDRPAPLKLPARPPFPTLRYLLVHITDRCNLKCRHCFLGAPRGRELSLADMIRVAEEFQGLHGLRFLVSGGEPLRHPRFRELNERLPAYRFRSVLLTNGTLITRRLARELRFHEAQVSIDGLEDSHDLLRGKGSYQKTLRGLRHLAEAGIDLSVATMVHAGNLDQFDRLKTVLEEFPLKSWSIDVPCQSGNLLENMELIPDQEEAAAKIDFSFGGGYYGSSGPYACGAHLAAVMAGGAICKCGHFDRQPSGSVSGGLAAAWRKMRRFTLHELLCRCSFLEECRGGCRQRARIFSCLYSPDPIQCIRRQVPIGGNLG